MKIYEKYINTLREYSKKQSEERFVANQLLEMHTYASSKESPLIVELGVDKGQSTKVFLNAISDKPNAKLISIDIKDCKNAASSENWQFVQQDSGEIESLISKKPIIKNGIDILYVDSLHTQSHVLKEVYSYFEYIKPKGVIRAAQAMKDQVLYDLRLMLGYPKPPRFGETRREHHETCVEIRSPVSNRVHPPTG